MRRILYSLFSLLALAGLLLTAACTSGQGTASTQSTATPIPMPVAVSKPTYKVARGDIFSQVQFSARVVPAVQEDLSFRAEGRIRRIYVRAGQPVEKGQVLADLFTLDKMEAQKRQQEHTLRRAQINLEMAKLRQQMFATQTPSWTPSYDLQMKMQEYEVELAQIALEETELNSADLDAAIADSQILSPIDGKVLSVSVSEGSEVKAFKTILTVGDSSTLEIGAGLNSSQMGDLQEGMPAQISLPARPGETLSGSIRSMPYPYGTGGGTSRPSGQSGDNTTRIALDNPEDLKSFRLGDMVTVTVILESKENVLWLPPQAVRSFEGRNFVVIQTDGLPRRADIRIGIKNEEKVEILEGLEEGQVVIAP